MAESIDNQVDNIILRVTGDTKNAKEQFLQFEEVIAKSTGKSKKYIKALTQAILETIPAEFHPRILEASNLILRLGQDSGKAASQVDRLAQAQARLVEKGLQRRATNQVAENDKLYSQRVAAEEQARKAAEKRAQQMGLELEQVAKLEKEYQALQSRLKSGTATIQEYSTALLTGQNINGKSLKSSSISSMRSIQPGIVNNQSISQVTNVMREIQAITGQSTERVRQMMRTMFTNIDTKNLDMAAKKIQGFPSTIMKSIRDVGNVIKGTLTAMFVFTIGQAITKLFSDALTQAKKFRGEMVQLNFAEAVLSKKGMDITRKELDDFVVEVQKQFKYVTKLEAISIVSDVADIGAEFNLTKDKILGLSEAITFIQLKEKMMGQEASDSGSIINAALDARSNYFNKLGVNITDALVKQKAYDMGLAQEGAELSKNAKNQAAMQLLIEQTANKRQELLDAIEQTNPALAEELRLQQRLADAQLELGNNLITLQDAWNGWLLSIGSLDGGTSSVTTFVDALKILAFILAWIWKGTTTAIGLLLSPIAEATAAIGDLVILISQLFSGDFEGAKETLANRFRNFGQAAKESFLRGWELGGDPSKFIDSVGKTDSNISTDTPTGATPLALGTGEDVPENKLQEALDKAREEILQAQQKLEQDLVDAEIDLQRKLEDIDTEYLEKRAEAWIDYQEKVADINRDYSDRVADINRDYNDTVSEIQQEASEKAQEARNDALEKEAEFQNKLLEMREDFLMSLEDALHARDARQVLKLISQYELDKKQAERAHALDMQKEKDSAKIEQQKVQREIKAAQEKRARDIAEAEIDRKRKLADAELDYQQKMAQLKREEDSEISQARLADQRKREDLIRGMKDRLAIMAADLVNQYNLTKSGLDAILKLFQAYYGDKGYLSQVMAGMNARLPSTTGTKPTPVETGLSTSQNDSRRGRGFAEGGTLIANRPTTVTFGEGGLEMASFIPLSRMGNNVNKTFTNLTDSGGVGGKISIELLLSPDLESRVVENSLNATAEIIQRVQRSK